MKSDVDVAVSKIHTHAWGTLGMKSPANLSDVLLGLERGESTCLDLVRDVVIADLQTLNGLLRKDNPEEVQPASIPMELAYAMSKIFSLLLESATHLEQHRSHIVIVARDLANAWHCLLSCDIENIEDGF